MKKMLYLLLSLCLISCATTNVVSSVVEENVVVNEGGEYPLKGKLLVPEGVKNPPIVVFVHGSGVSDYNEAIFENTPFLDIATSLARSGIASIRYDKRYFEDPTAAPSMNEIGAREETLDDVKAAIALVKGDKRFEKSKVFIVGHSLGGFFAPAIAAENSEVSGIIALAGTARPLYELMYDQVMESYSTIDRATLDAQTNAILDMQLQMVNSDIDTLRTKLDLVDDATLLFGVPAQYFKSLNEYSPKAVLAKVNVPMLILQGDKDFQVYPEVDFPLWKELLKEKDNVSYKLYPGLNHLFMTTNGKRDITEYQIKGTVSQEVIDDITSFINKNCKNDVKFSFQGEIVIAL